MGTWLNSDGLYIKFGTDEATQSKSGEYNRLGPLHELAIDLDYTMVQNSSATIISDSIRVPAGARIERVQVVTHTAWDSAADNFVLNLGLVRLDRSTTFDVDAFIAALPQASMDPAGEIQEIIIGHTYVGSAVGTTLAYSGLVTADYDTGAPTAGASKIRIYYYMP